MTERLLNRTMGKEELEHFEQILLNDPSARLAYIEHIHVHAELSHLGGAAEALGDEVFAERQRPAAGMSAVIATVVTCCLILGLAIYATVTRPGPESAGTILGHIIPDLDVQSSITAGNQPNPQVIKIGELLNLHFGMTQFQLSNGVSCTLHGPAQIKFESSTRVKLKHGTFVANVPPEAVGFCVETPHVEVIDLGTAFSLSVGEDSELRVFQGVVAARKKSVDVDDTRPLLVRSGESIRFNNLKSAPSEIVKDRKSEGKSESKQALAGLERLYGIRTLKGSVQLLASPPRSVRLNDLQNNSAMSLLQERSNVELDRPLSVVPPVPGTYRSPGNYVPLELPAGTRCGSFLLHCDPPQATAPMSATIRFDRPILGLIFSADGLQKSDSIFGLPEVKYPADASVYTYMQSRGCVIPYGNNEEANDEIRVHDDRKGISVKLNSPGANLDQIRILIAPNEI